MESGQGIHQLLHCVEILHSVIDMVYIVCGILFCLIVPKVGETVPYGGGNGPTENERERKDKAK